VLKFYCKRNKTRLYKCAFFLFDEWQVHIRYWVHSFHVILYCSFMVVSEVHSLHAILISSCRNEKSKEWVQVPKTCKYCHKFGEFKSPLLSVSSWTNLFNNIDHCRNKPRSPAAVVVPLLLLTSNGRARCHLPNKSTGMWMLRFVNPSEQIVLLHWGSWVRHVAFRND
jgi:hypothetical protein